MFFAPFVMAIKLFWSDSCKKILLVELTVRFEHNYEKAANRKKDRYSDLASNINAAGYDCLVIPVQVGSRDYIDTTSLTSSTEIPTIEHISNYLRTF